MKLLITFLLVFCFVAVGSAQERVIDEAEFNSVVAEGGKHQLKWKGEKYRMTVASSAKTDGRPATDWSSNMIFEYGPPKVSRSVTTSTFGEKILPAKEFITIGDVLYQRIGSGVWTRPDRTGASAPQGSEKAATRAQTLITEVEYKYLGTENLAGTTVQVYLKTERGTSTMENGDKAEIRRTGKYWIGSDGLIMKSEHATEARGTTQTFRSSVISQYELDPTISIAAPKIVS